MNFIEIIGKHIDEIEFQSAYELTHEDEEWMREEGIAPTWTLTAQDGSFTIELTNEKIVEIVWLNPVESNFGFENFTVETTREIIQNRFGEPTLNGETESIMDEVAVCWDRYDTETIALHFEYAAEDKTLRMITIMDKNIAP